MPNARIRLGQLLVDAKLLRQSDLDEVLALQRTDGRRLGTLLLERGLVNETQLTQVLSHQLSVPWVSLVHIEFSRQLLNLVPHHVAERFCMVPIYVRHVRPQGQTLYVAMDDPSNDDGLRECEKHAGLLVKAMIAPPSDIRNAIRVYYGTKATPSLPPPPEARSSQSPASEYPSIEVMSSAPVTSLPAMSLDMESVLPSLHDEPESLSRMTLPELDLVLPDALDMNAPPTISGAMSLDLPPETLPDAGASRRFKEAATTNVRVPVVSASDVGAGRALEALGEAAPPKHEEAPASAPMAEIPQPKGPTPKMISLTLLDGTTISLPAPRKSRTGIDQAPASKPPAEVEEPPPSTLNEHTPSGLTARDLVAALRAICHGADPKEILGPNERIEAIVAALLSVMLRKGMVADWEFVDELRKI
jgi:type IV pilus assembly protein PilB